MSEGNNAKLKIRVFEVIISLLLTICLGLAAWNMTKTITNSEDIAVMKGNRFTSQNGLEVWQAIADVRENLAKVPSENPPKWFVERVSALETRIAGLQLESRLAQIQASLDANAKILDTFSRLLDAHMKESGRP